MQIMMERVLPFTLTLAIQIFAVSSMLMVGLRYTIGELARPLADVVGVALALATNFVLVPLLAILLLRVFPLEAPYATAGFRHAKNNPHLQATMVRSAAFFLFATAYG